MITLASARPVLSAAELARLIRDAGVPCVTLTDKAGVASEPASTRDEGLRIVDGSMPVRVFYAMPPGNDAATSRRGSHLLWLHDFVTQYRWSAQWPSEGWVTVHPEPLPATYVLDGRECFRATGRRVDEDLGAWVVFWVVDDAEACATAIEADVEADIAQAGKLRASRQYLNRPRLESAARIREEGPSRTVRSTEHDRAGAEAHVASLTPRPGVRYEAASITAAGACATCYCPMFEAGGQWWHHTGGYPAECPGPREGRSLPLEPGEWEITAISMTCGYCGESVSWPETQRSWLQLTGYWSLGVELATGQLVVLAEVIGIAVRPGKVGHLPHHCAEIPADVQARWAGGAAVLAELAAARGGPGG